MWRLERVASTDGRNYPGSAEIEQVIKEVATLAGMSAGPLMVVVIVIIVMARAIVPGRFRVGEAFEFTTVEEDAAALHALLDRDIPALIRAHRGTTPGADQFGHQRALLPRTAGHKISESL